MDRIILSAMVLPIFLKEQFWIIRWIIPTGDDKNNCIMKKLIYLAILFVILCSCRPPKSGLEENESKNETMVEKFDFELFKKYQASDGVLQLKNGYTILSMSAPDREEIGMQKELLPKPSFLYTYKEFYFNGYLKKKETRISEAVKVMRSEYYDEYGNLDKTVDEDSNYGRIKYQDILNFLDNNNYIDVKTEMED